MALTPEQAKFFRDANFAALGTIRADGSSHVSPVWVDYDGERPLFNTAEGRAKWRHLVRDPRATLQVVDPENPYEYIEVSGPVELTHEGADASIDALAKKYLGVDAYPYRREGEVRVIGRLTPEIVNHHGRG